MRIVSGEFKGRQIKAVPGKKTRPTLDKVKESIFNMIGPYFDGGIALDLFAGSGNLGLEALSRGINQCLFIERDYTAFNVIKENISSLKLEKQVEVFKSDAFKALKQIVNRELSFDIVFLDPPYKLQKINDIISFIDEHKLLNSNGMIVAEYGKEDQLEERFGEISELKTVTYGMTKISLFKRGVINE